jgi:hypothetical protein
MAALAGATELGGGLLTAAGAADPAGPLAIMGAMTVASVTHRARYSVTAVPMQARAAITSGKPPPGISRSRKIEVNPPAHPNRLGCSQASCPASGLSWPPSRALVAPVLFQSHRKRGILTMGIMSGA